MRIFNKNSQLTLRNYEDTLRGYETVINAMMTEVQILREALDHERMRNDELHGLFYQYFGLCPVADKGVSPLQPAQTGNPLRRWRDQRSVLERKFGQTSKRPEELAQREKMWTKEAAKAQEEVDQCQSKQEKSTV